jgi:hypothetical protein
MNRQDEAFLTSLGFQAGRGSSWRLFYRKGNLLMILPDESRKMRRGLALYRPQKWLAGMMVRVIGSAPFGSRMLPRWKGDHLSSGPVSEILGHLKGELDGLLLGNPLQDERRAILLTDTASRGRLIVKLGTTPPAIAKIRREGDFLKSHYNEGWMMPEIHHSWTEENWSAFAMTFQGAPAAPSQSGLCRLFKMWAADGRVCALGDFAGWKDLHSVMVECQVDTTTLQELQELELRQTLRHGDFAPWNLLGPGNGGELTVIDWEFGEVDSIPGLDLVHYLIIPAILVDGLAPLAALEAARASLQNEPGFQELMMLWGWRDRIDLLLKIYCYSMKGELEGFDELARAV